MTDAERPPEGAREGLKPKQVRELLYEVVARKVLEIARTHPDGVGLTAAEEELVKHGMSAETEEDRLKIRRRAHFVMGKLETTGLLWARGSHYESADALRAQNFDEEHVARNPFDKQKVLTKKQIKKLPDWLAELVRSNP